MKKSQKNRKMILVAFTIVIEIMLNACGKENEQVVNNQGKHAEYEEKLEDKREIDLDFKQEIFADEQPLNMINSYEDLNVATYITKLDDTPMYFISDCYHDQILYNDNIDDEISKWKVLTNDVHYAHTIATDGQVMVIDDTENNRVIIFNRLEDGRFAKAQIIEGIGMKPHFVYYDVQNKVFMVWSSITGEMYYIKRSTGNAGEFAPLYVDKVLKIEELFGVYVRSFSVIEDSIYFVSGHNNSKIIKADKNTLDIEEYFEVPDEIAGMVQVSRIQDYFYITVSTDANENQDYATIIRTKDLSLLIEGKYEDIYDEFGINGGTPYYINCIDGRYYMSHHRTGENILVFDVIDNDICNVEVIY